MTPALPRFPSVRDVAVSLEPREPVYCLHPARLERDVRRFLDGFPGRVMYAVKANPQPQVLAGILRAGVRDFDAASVPEMRAVHELDAGATCWFMAPVRLRGAAREAWERHGVRHYVIDHADELQRLAGELPGREAVVFVRMAAGNADATYNLSEKFGAEPAEAARLLHAVRDLGMQPALAFNTGSLLRRPDAFVTAMEQSNAVLEKSGVEVSLLDVGGGFPRDYPGMPSAPLEEFFAAIDDARRRLPRLADLELLAEPGRALIAGCLTTLVQVLHRNDGALYLNDGVWGSFMEPVLARGELRYPARVWRDGREIAGDTEDFVVFGPTCDSMDRLPAPLPFPRDIRAGDYVELADMGAYSLTNRTRFNGFWPDTFVEIAD